MSEAAANPAELRDYVTGVKGPRSDAYDARRSFVDAYEAFVAAAPQGYEVPMHPSIAGPLGHSRDVDNFVTTVADDFERAGSAGEDGIFTLDATTLTPYMSIYAEDQRAALRARAEEELARLRENIRSGSSDETTTGELVAVLGWMRHEVDTAADPQAIAADLIDTMGPLDLHEALGMLESAALAHDEITPTTWPIQAMENLAVLVSLGLENQPTRATRWSTELAERRDFYHDQDAAEDLALLAGFVAPGTQTFGVALVEQLWEAGPTPDGGLVEQLYDTNAPLQPILENAAESPSLANGIVNHLLDHAPSIDGLGREHVDRLSELFSTAHTADPRFADIPDSVLANVIDKSVAPSLAPIPRVETADRLAAHYVSAHEALNFGYSDPITHSFAASTQPLLEHWYPSEENVVVSSPPAPDFGLEDDNLIAALELYGDGRIDGRIEGLQQALRGTMSTLVSDAFDAGVAHLEPGTGEHDHAMDSLERLGEVYGATASEIGNARILAVFDAVDGGDPGQAIMDVYLGALGEAPGGDLAAGILDAALELHGSEVSGGGNPVAGFENQLTTLLVARTLEARPDLATPELVAGIDRALARAVSVEDGHDVLHSLMEDNGRFPAVAYGGEALADLRRLIDMQVDSTGAMLVQSLGDLTADD